MLLVQWSAKDWVDLDTALGAFIWCGAFTLTSIRIQIFLFLYGETEVIEYPISRTLAATSVTQSAFLEAMLSVDRPM